MMTMVEQDKTTEAEQRHDFLAEPGETLLDAVEPVERLRRSVEFGRLTGLDAIDTVDSPLVSVPLPRYPAGFEQGRRRWVGVKATAMWHPFMWLPGNLSDRYTIELDDDAPAIESDDVWAVRVMHELTINKFYDPATGQWLDILALHGLDRMDEDDLSRVQAWLDGGSDEILDSIDLTEAFTQDNPELEDWAIRYALAEMQDNSELAWSTGSAHVADSTAGLMGLRGDVDVPEADWAAHAATAASGLAVVGRFYLGHVLGYSGEPLNDQWVSWFERAKALSAGLDTGDATGANVYALLMEMNEESARIYRALNPGV